MISPPLLPMLRPTTRLMLSPTLHHSMPLRIPRQQTASKPIQRQTLLQRWRFRQLLHHLPTSSKLMPPVTTTTLSPPTIATTLSPPTTATPTMLSPPTTATPTTLSPPTTATPTMLSPPTTATANLLSPPTTATPTTHNNAILRCRQRCEVWKTNDSINDNR